jgi:Amt family ammonium transporter
MSFDPATYCESSFADESIEAGLCLAFSTIDEMTTGLNTFFLLFAASFVFMMQAGFAMLCAGSIRQKNVKNIMLKNILDACGGALGFWSVGYAFAYGGSSSDTKSFIGNEGFFLAGMDTAADLISWFFQFAFAATAATIVAGTVAERCKMEAYLCYSFFLTGFVYPVIVHSIWSTSGFISAFNDDKLFGCGMHDFAGSGVVHLTGGITAIIAAIILGPRIGRFYDRDGIAIANPKAFAPHSVALQVLGTFILWVGWYGFNPGSTLFINTSTAADVTSLAAVNTTIGAASGCLSAMFTDMFMYRRKTGETAYDITMVMNGTLTGLVCVTAGCSVMEPWAAFVTGIVGGWVYIFYSNLIVKLKIDDAVDAIPVHFGGGSWGCIALGLFAEPTRTAKAFGEHGHYGWFYNFDDGNLLGAQICGCLWIIGWVCATMIPFLLLVNLLGWFRVDSIEEEVGLDISHHKGAAYDLTGPDEKTVELYDLHKSQHKLDVLKEVSEKDDVAQDVPTKDTSSEAGYNAFVASVSVP